jgi:altronate hydrolase
MTCGGKEKKLGHREFILTDKSFEPLGPACLPAG